jgi:hypothetical protein
VVADEDPVDPGLVGCPGLVEPVAPVGGRGSGEVLAATGFEPVVPPHVPVTAPPAAQQVALLRTVIDPRGDRKRGVRPAVP